MLVIIFVGLVDQEILAGAAYSKAAVWLGFIRPMPPIFTGSAASSSRSACVQL